MVRGIHGKETQLKYLSGLGLAERHREQDGLTFRVKYNTK